MCFFENPLPWRSRKGFGSALWATRYRSVVAMRAEMLGKAPRRPAFSVRFRNHRSAKVQPAGGGRGEVTVEPEVCRELISDVRMLVVA